MVNKVAIFNQTLFDRFANLSGVSVSPQIEAKGAASTSLTLEEISQQLDARYLLDGSIREDDDDMIITISFVDAKNHENVFTRTLRSKMNVFVTDAEKIIQPISRMVSAEIPLLTVQTDSLPSNDVAAKKCKSYIDLMELYAREILADVSTIAIKFLNITIV